MAAPSEEWRLGQKASSGWAFCSVSLASKLVSLRTRPDSEVTSNFSQCIILYLMIVILGWDQAHGMLVTKGCLSPPPAQSMNTHNGQPS